jgi:hypothetical protein
MRAGGGLQCGPATGEPVCVLLECECSGAAGTKKIPSSWQDDGRRRESLRYLAENVPESVWRQLSLEQVAMNGPGK